MSDLVGNPEDRFSRVEAQMIRLTLDYMYQFVSLECSKACRPTWLSQVTMYLGTVQSASHPMCAFKDRFPDCTTSSTCSKKNTNCCPIRCLKEIKACWKGTESICVPETISYGKSDD